MQITSTALQSTQLSPKSEVCLHTDNVETIQNLKINLKMVLATNHHYLRRISGPEQYLNKLNAISSD